MAEPRNQFEFVNISNPSEALNPITQKLVRQQVARHLQSVKAVSASRYLNRQLRGIASPRPDETANSSAQLSAHQQRHTNTRGVSRNYDVEFRDDFLGSEVFSDSIFTTNLANEHNHRISNDSKMRLLFLFYPEATYAEILGMVGRKWSPLDLHLASTRTM